MELSKQKIEELISAAERIIEAQKDNKKQLLFDLTENDENLNNLKELLDPDVLVDPDKSYDLFYNGIQALLLSVLPKDNDIRVVILELKSILLTGKEKAQITHGKRGADSRMAGPSTMEYVIDILSEWSQTPHDLLKLSYLLLNKNKELAYVPQERVISDYIRN